MARACSATSALASGSVPCSIRSPHQSRQSAPAGQSKKGPSSKVKSTCPNCGGNAWAKPNYQLACVACGNVPMLAENKSYDRAA